MAILDATAGEKAIEFDGRERQLVVEVAQHDVVSALPKHHDDVARVELNRALQACDRAIEIAITARDERA